MDGVVSLFRFISVYVRGLLRYLIQSVHFPIILPLLRRQLTTVIEFGDAPLTPVMYEGDAKLLFFRSPLRYVSRGGFTRRGSSV